jgi:2-keto-4-pentenoate hydratase/2-oxohepta-3-ene-1,7-dioic acid hydratase in catechol pathway
VKILKLLTFSIKGEYSRVGILTNIGILDLPNAYKKVYDSFEAPDFFYSMRKFIAFEELSFDIAKELLNKSLNLSNMSLFIDPKEVKWEPPVPNPEKVFCVAINYREHSKESGASPPPKPYFFPKFANALIGHENPIIKPKISEKVDWEVELGVVIGKAGKYIDKKDALNHVFGYTVVNDISMRDWQYPSAESLGFYWIWGKSMDSTTPVGPYIVTKDEIPDPNNLRLTLKVNGNIEQNGNTRNLIFNIEDLIHWASQGVTLKPGDYISTGTPSGVGMSKNKFLKHGDIVEAEVENIGVLRNKVISEV